VAFILGVVFEFVLSDRPNAGKIVMACIFVMFAVLRLH